MTTQIYANYTTHGLLGDHSVICFKDHLSVVSRGYFCGDDPMAHVFPVMLVQIISIIFLSRLLHFILGPLKQPVFVCNVLAGITIGPSIAGYNLEVFETLFPPKEAILQNTVSAIGLIYYVFIITVKLDVELTIRTAKKIWKISFASFCASFVVTLCLLFPLAPKQISLIGTEHIAFDFASMCSFSSSAIIAHSLEELNFITSELGQIALSCAMLHDIVSWSILIVSAVTRHKKAMPSVYAPVVVLLLLSIAVFLIRPAVKLIIKRTPHGKPVREVYIIFLLVGVLVMAAVTDMVGLTCLFAPVILGVMIPGGPPLGSALVEKMDAIISQVFLPLYFLSIGLNTDCFSIVDAKEVLSFQAILFGGTFAKLLATMLTALALKIKLKNAFVLALILNLKGVVDMITYSRWKNYEIIDAQIFSQLVLYSLVLTGILTPLISTLYNPYSQLEHSAKPRLGIKPLQNTPRNTEFRIISLIHGEENVHGIITLLEASNPTGACPLCVYVIHLIELTGQRTPHLLPYHKKYCKSLGETTLHTQHIMRAFDNYSSNFEEDAITIHPFINVAAYKNMHDYVRNVAKQTLTPLIITPLHEKEEELYGMRVGNSIRGLNYNLLAYAPCTVGILVDKGLENVRKSDFSFHVLIFFIGGPDDREAVAFGARMSDNRNVSVSLLRLIIKNQEAFAGGTSDHHHHRMLSHTTFEDEEQYELEVQKKIDDTILEEFEMRNLGNASTFYQEIAVDGVEQCLQAIKNTKGDYDLVMVGRRHGAIFDAVEDEEMEGLIDNMELGVIGDMLASEQFCKGKVSVLVMQHWEANRTIKFCPINSTASHCSHSHRSERDEHNFRKGTVL